MNVSRLERKSQSRETDKWVSKIVSKLLNSLWAWNIHWMVDYKKPQETNNDGLKKHKQDPACPTPETCRFEFILHILVLIHFSDHWDAPSSSQFGTHAYQYPHRQYFGCVLRSQFYFEAGLHLPKHQLSASSFHSGRELLSVPFVIVHLCFWWLVLGGLSEAKLSE